MKDYFRLLGVAQDAPPEAIRRAFRTLALAVHPDLTGDGDSEAFLLLREAYETLIDPERRVAYQEGLKRMHRQREPAFNRPRHPQGKRPKSSPTAPPEHTTATKGNYTAKSANRNRSAPPSYEYTTTSYSGDQEPAPPQVCQARHLTPADGQPGSRDILGTLEITLEDSLKAVAYEVILAQIPGRPGERRTVAIRTPAGVWDGCELLAEGLGYCVPGEANGGNLRVTIAFAPHQQLRRVGEHLHFDIDVSPWELALGFRRLIPTLEGNEPVIFPPAPETSSMKRLKGRGLLHADGSRGDLWVHLRLQITPPPSFRARRLWAELAEEYRHYR